MIWASRHFQKANPQNLLRPSDLMRILVPWRAFGDLDAAKRLLESHAAQLTREVEAHRDQRLADIEDAYGPVLAPLKDLDDEQTRIDALDLKVKAVNEAIGPDHPWFHPLVPLKAEVDGIQAQIDAAGHDEKAVMKARLIQPKHALDEARKQLVTAIRERGKQVSRAVKELKKLQDEFRLRFKDLESVSFCIPYMWQSLTFRRRLQAKAKSESGLWKIGKRDIEKELLALPGKDEQ